MKILKNIIVLFIVSLGVQSCKKHLSPEIKTIQLEAHNSLEDKSKLNFDPNVLFAKTEFEIEGMTCAMGCAKTIEKRIAQMDGVKSAVVDFKNKMAMVEYDKALITLGSLKKTVINLSSVYKVKQMKTVNHFSNLNTEN